MANGKIEAASMCEGLVFSTSRPNSAADLLQSDPVFGEEPRSAFARIDKDGSGTVDMEENRENHLAAAKRIETACIAPAGNHSLLVDSKNSQL